MPGPGVIVTERGVEQHFGLPAEMSSLVGRGPEIAAVLDGLRTARVVTLTGPGGCGKTRLALRAAALAAGGFEDGARLVELASLTDPALVPASVAAALGVPDKMPRIRWQAWRGRWRTASCWSCWTTASTSWDRPAG